MKNQGVISPPVPVPSHFVLNIHMRYAWKVETDKQFKFFLWLISFPMCQFTRTFWGRESGWCKKLGPSKFWFITTNFLGKLSIHGYEIDPWVSWQNSSCRCRLPASEVARERCVQRSIKQTSEHSHKELSQFYDKKGSLKIFELWKDKGASKNGDYFLSVSDPL